MCSPTATLITAIVFHAFSLILGIVAIAAPWIVYAVPQLQNFTTVSIQIFFSLTTVSGLDRVQIPGFPSTRLSGSSTYISLVNQLPFNFGNTLQWNSNMTLASNNGTAAIALFSTALICIIISAIFAIIRVTYFSKPNSPLPGCVASPASTVVPNVIGFLCVIIAGACGWVGTAAAFLTVNNNLLPFGSTGLSQGGGSICAGVMFITFLVALICDAVSYPCCCCGNRSSAPKEQATSITVIANNPYTFPQQQQQLPQQFPAPIPYQGEWRSMADPTGKVYYYNTATNATSWTPPPGFPEAPPSSMTMPPPPPTYPGAVQVTTV